jgi:hypothetical protein
VNYFLLQNVIIVQLFQATKSVSSEISLHSGNSAIVFITSNNATSFPDDEEMEGLQRF